MVLSYIVGDVLQASGYQVEYVPFDSQLQFRALADGQLHFQVAVWEGPMKSAFEQALSEGMVDAGTHSATSREDWWIPDYVLDDCPEAINWQGLNDCAKLFASTKSAPAGQFLGPPADWGKNYARRINALQMDFVVVNVANIIELWQRLETAYAHREPIVLFNWTPNFPDLMYRGRFVDFPQFAAACHTSAMWGPNPDETGDCGEPIGWLKKAAWGGLEAMHPEAWKILKRIDFTREHIARAIQLVDIEGMSAQQAARQWSEENAELLQNWTRSE